MAEIEEFLKAREEAGLLRKLTPVEKCKNSRIIIAGKEYIDFSSNDYLGLSMHPRLIEVSKAIIDKFGTASSASRLMSGDLKIHHLLEERIAKFKNKESALVFNSGYQANLGIISSLYGRKDVIFSDRFSHASIIDGIILSRARHYRFQHNDVQHLELLLKKERNKFDKALIITETVFSMDGDKAPLKAIVDLKEKYNCEFMVDEAHATGIFGENGSGMAEEEGVSNRVDFIMGTFSKALAGFGAYLAASKKTTDYLINTCRSFIYSTALPPAIIACNLASLDLVKEETLRKVQLLESAEFFRKALIEKGFEVTGNSQIVPVIIKDTKKTIEFANILKNHGFWVLPIRPPTVPKGQARLRFSLTFDHRKEILQNVINEISKIRV